MYTIHSKTGTPLTEFIASEQASMKEHAHALTGILSALCEGGKTLHQMVNKAGLLGVEGVAGTENVQGEEQQKLDVLANDLFFELIAKSGHVCAVASEECEDLMYTGNDHQPYVVAMDPLDGSSNIDVNMPIGTIFSVYHRKTSDNHKPIDSDVLVKGEKQLMSGYLLYSTSTMLVLTYGRGVHIFTYNADSGIFQLSYHDVKFPESGKIYSCNEGNYKDFPDGFKAFFNQCKEKSYTARYIGSLIADFHRNLLKGGVFVYPPTRKAPNGKLRLIYECNPLAFIAEQAGGIATDGRQSILTIPPMQLHQRAPLVIGSKHLVKEVMDLVLIHD